MIRTIIADDQSLFRAGIKRLLRDIRAIDVVAEADTGEEAVDLARRLNPHVVSLEIMMPGIGGLEAARRILKMETGTQIVMLSAAWDAPYPMQALRAGACGFVTKRGSPQEVVAAIKRAYAGKRFVSSDIAQQLAFRSVDDPIESPFDNLSSRELQITLMVINCQRVNDISANLHLSPKTVNSYRYRIFDKLNVGSDVELALLAVKHGMINPILGSFGERAMRPEIDVDDALAVDFLDWEE
ncbi:MAG: response regulator [Gammaproteobacteria bacterium]|nr:response regulator [Gammaproteobacteria bacterium]